MIIEWIITFVITILELVIGIFPSANPDVTTFLTNGWTDFLSRLATIDWLFPVNTFLMVLGIVLTIEAVLFTFQIAKWVATNVSGGLFKK